MSLRHHPNADLLLAHAAGHLPEPMMLLVASHLHFCATCRAEVALGDAVGGALLADAAPAPMASDALARTLARLDRQVAFRQAANDDTPQPLRDVLGHGLDGVRWRPMGRNLAYATLHRRNGLTLRLLRGRPGSDVGVHTHRGIEHTLVLRGGYRDETGAYGPGDFQTADGSTLHNPVADPGEDCITLAVTVGGLRFPAFVPNLVARLFGF